MTYDQLQPGGEMSESTEERGKAVAVTRYTTVQVADDKWKYSATETRIFQPHETLADIVAWAARNGGNVHWDDLVFSQLSEPEEPR